MRDVNNGWLVRYLHSNTASAFFFLVYLHIGRGMYYGSYRAPRTLVWVIGTIILVAMIGTGFLGYVHSPKWFKINKKFNLTSKRCFSTSTSTKDSIKSNLGDRVEKFLIDKNLNPVFLYEDLKKQDVKDIIKNDLKDLSGVYLILNKSTLDYYVGSASTGKFYARFYRHLINLSGSKIVKLAVRKYGLDNFVFMILELFPEKVNVENNKKLLDLEDFYLKSLLPNYNILTEAGKNFGYKHTEVDRIKMKANYSEERRSFIANLNKGRTFSEETIKRMRESALNKAPCVYSEEALSNMKKNSCPIILYNLGDNTVYGEYSSILEAAASVNCNEKTIRRVLKTEKKILLRSWRVELK